jgi:hypothetical protein
LLIATTDVKSHPPANQLLSLWKRYREGGLIKEFLMAISEKCLDFFAFRLLRRGRGRTLEKPTTTKEGRCMCAWPEC